MERAFITLRGLTRNYSLSQTIVPALSEFDLDVPQGDFTALVGPSGSGKSTLLNLLGGLDRPTRGEIWVDGLSLDQASEPQLVRYRRDRVGFIFQSFNLLPNLNAVENVEAPMVLAEVPAAERRARAQNLLETVGLAQRALHRPNEMSGGEKQRVAIARALANRPSLLLADEPTGNLDSKTSAAVLDLLWNLLKSNGITLMLVTHDLEIAARAHRVVHLRDGCLQKVESNQKTKDPA
jgi:putative ABC transport system ATP-binding protein